VITGFDISSWQLVLVLALTSMVLCWLWLRNGIRLRDALAASANLRTELESAREDSYKALSNQDRIAALREELAGFSALVSNCYQDEKREVYALRHTVESLGQVHRTMNDQTRQLAEAMRGNPKFSGSWGELSLERVLEAAGLVVGRDYVREGVGLGLQDANGRRRRPDVVVFLPRGRHLIIDAKLSLAAWQGIGAQDSRESESKDRNRTLVQSVRNQMLLLSAKEYERLEGLQAPHFILMYIPLEGVFHQLFEVAPELFDEAWSKGIMFCSPTTLVPTIRLVAELWREENRARHADLITQRAFVLCDRLETCLEEFAEFGNRIDTLGNHYNKLRQRWTGSKGSVAVALEEIRNLGGDHGADPVGASPIAEAKTDLAASAV
jgi:DNA recombination protein RmuC